jgi:hypothetical protein
MEVRNEPYTYFEYSFENPSNIPMLPQRLPDGSTTKVYSLWLRDFAAREM